MTILDIIVEYRAAFLRGLYATLRLAMIIWVSGIVGGTILGVVGAKWQKTLGRLSRFISFTLGSIPVLVILFWLHYPAQGITGVLVDPFITAAICLSTINILFFADILRSALVGFPEQYVMAARVCGLPPGAIFYRIQLPVIFREIIPSSLQLQVIMLQSTIFASLISVEELFRVTQQVNAAIYRPVEVYTLLAVFFLILCAPLNLLALWLKSRFGTGLYDK